MRVFLRDSRRGFRLMAQGRIWGLVQMCIWSLPVYDHSELVELCLQILTGLRSPQLRERKFGVFWNRSIVVSIFQALVIVSVTKYIEESP